MVDSLTAQVVYGFYTGSIQDEHSTGSEGLPEEVLAASFSFSGSEQWPTAGGGSSFQVNMNVFWFSFNRKKVLLLQSFILHLQQVREQQLRQSGPG